MRYWLLSTFLSMQSVRHRAEGRLFRRAGLHWVADYADEISAAERSAAISLLGRI